MDGAELNTAVGDRLADVLASEDEMITKWLAVVEVVDGDGKRWLRTLTNDGAQPWDNVGLLTFALQWEQAAAVRDGAEQ
jgi:hypothetical protein